jgi:3-oxoacyl-[acyl-carrier protein] reductase
MGRLAGHVALVTGGTRGIGLAVVGAYLAEGASVMAAGSTERSLERGALARLVGPRCAAVAGDLGMPQGAEPLVSATIARFGKIDILVNNAGIVGPADLWKITADEWDRVLAVNLRATFFAARAAAENMRGRGGCIINISSVAAQTGGAATGAAYVASKAGMMGLTRSLARQFGPLGIRVNCIAPADIETDMTAGWPEELRKRLIAATPLSRFGEPDEVASLAVFLAQPQAAYITGQTVSVNGGLYMG